MSLTSCDPKVIVALDFDNQNAANELILKLDPNACRLKIGKEMFTYFGPDWVKKVVALGFDVFLDLKFHDIPNTVAKAVKAAASLGVWMVNVHASGGPDMMKAAIKALKETGTNRPLLTAVTVLTSMDQNQLDSVVGNIQISEQVKRLALLTQECGLDGVVCSAQEAIELRKVLNNDFLLVTPGIRPIGSKTGDQVRIATPLSALQSGVNYLVIGRPITQATDPLSSLNDINASICHFAK
ncbi:orotidine-5'-phosphate decarboxylase [Brumicola pallidula]|jgi:orotidine-5'-phosphate decarboxylase|uniref:Orotidine 5'-phosphate decarboxylase n=1 Tax=Brumicola pallidula DSM 14239 = ACAM 615 TaxID=1121922 RepID=K6ZKB7_9ALTE|nr:orotidine-5'-phosphate decarboxylase [Glaciecola pallidula]GAC29328.1 orotidine-5'-phosphate decarboxylase [Glaciecola pallidula DSM 14239 = ACAM 615]